MLERGSSGSGARGALARFTLILLLLLAGLPVTSAVAGPSADISGAVTNVIGATAHRYAATDSAGNAMNALKIIESPAGGYIGVYNSWSNGHSTVKTATSQDLMNWTFRVNLDVDGAQATIAAAPDGFVVAYAKLTGCASGGACLFFRHYSGSSSLLAGKGDRTFRAERTLSSCDEGTPNIYSVTATSIDVGFYYRDRCGVALQARGTLANWSSWTAASDTNMNNLFQSLGSVSGDVRDRDWGGFEGRYYSLQEAELVKGDASSWRPFLYDAQMNKLSQLAVRTNGGSRSFSAPTFTALTAPSGHPAVVVTYNVRSDGAAAGEAGELIFYKQFPVVAAAGDIACASSTAGSGSCHQQATSDLLQGATAVLALGDNQYPDGLLSDYGNFYGPTWGRFKDRTFPIPGNHEYHTSAASGYFDYFNGVGSANGLAGTRGAGYYSFDIGKWHLIALNSNCGSISRGSASDGCAAGSPQEQWLRADLAAHPNQCVLAYWHHPRFSSGTTHGDKPAVAPFWDDLYAAHADLVLNGHEHNYERYARQRPDRTFDPSGLREFVVGAGGANHYSFGTAEPNSLVRNSDTFGVLKLTLYPSGFEWQLVPESGKTFTDSGRGACQ